MPNDQEESIKDYSNEQQQQQQNVEPYPIEVLRRCIGREVLGHIYDSFMDEAYFRSSPVNYRSFWNLHAARERLSEVIQRSPYISILCAYSTLLGEFCVAILVPGSLSKIQVDCIEYPDCYKVFMDMPGVKQESLDIHLEERILLIQGDRQINYGKDGEPIIHERFCGPFIVHIPVNIEYINIDNVKATLADGVLTIVMQKVNEPKEKKVHKVVFEEEKKIQK